MAEDQDPPAKSSAEQLGEVLSRLKEMEHYSRANIEKLGTDWFHVSDTLKEAALAEELEKLTNVQNQFQDLLVTVIEKFEEAISPEG
ncbi:hypothetical protein BH23VER1_BH23VER1_21620 [soil metagenome]